MEMGSRSAGSGVPTQHCLLVPILGCQEPEDPYRLPLGSERGRPRMPRSWTAIVPWYLLW